MVHLWWWFRILRFLNAYISYHFLPFKWKGMQHMNSSRAVKCCSTKPSTTRYQGPTSLSPLSLFGDKLSDLIICPVLSCSLFFKGVACLRVRHCRAVPGWLQRPVLLRGHVRRQVEVQGLAHWYGPSHFCSFWSFWCKVSSKSSWQNLWKLRGRKCI